MQPALLDRWYRGARRVALILVVLLSALLLRAPSPVRALDPDELPIISDEAWEAIQWPEAPWREAYPKLGSALGELAQAATRSPEAALDLARQRDVRLWQGRVQTNVVVAPGSLALVSDLLEARGGLVTGRVEEDGLLQVWLPPDQLAEAVDLPDVLYVRQPDYAHPVELALAIESEGVAASNADAWHDAGITGAGVKVGIIDVGFIGYEALLGSELPDAVITGDFVDDDDPLPDSSHGTVCAELVHDVAPGAELYLARIASTVDLAEAVDWLVANEVDVISTSIVFYNVAPGDGTGLLAQQVEYARGQGILWATSAGNDRQLHWEGEWVDSDDDQRLDFYAFHEENYIGIYTDPSDVKPYLTPAGYDLTAYLRWSDWDGASAAYKAYFLRCAADATCEPVYGQVLEWTPGKPVLKVSAETRGDSAYYAICVIQQTEGSPDLELFVPSADVLDYPVYASSLPDLADAPYAMTVAAVDPDIQDLTEPYSSMGPTNGPGGVIGGGLAKPDATGYDRVSTATYGASGQFAGTSAAAPHVAGAAALVLAVFPDMAPDAVEDFLLGRAVDIEDADWDVYSGYGRLWLGTPLPDPPQLMAPAAGSRHCGRRPVFSWQPVAEATSYRLQVSESTAFAEPLLCNLVTSSLSASCSEDLPEGRLFWRVQSLNASGAGPWSEVRRLEIVDSGDIVVVPDRVDAGWEISGPENFAGSGSQVIEAAPSGDYTIVWQPLAYQSAPISETKTLSACGDVRFEGDYSFISTVMHVVPQWSRVGLGYAAQATIAAANVSSLSAFTVTLAYDPAMLELELDAITLGDWIEGAGADFALAVDSDPLQGRVTLSGEALPGGGSGPSGDGDLLCLRFLPQQAGSAALTIEDAVLLNGEGIDVLEGTLDGGFRVGQLFLVPLVFN